MTFNESTSYITRICNLQNDLLDHTGHVRRGTSRDDRRALVGEINRMRDLVGWAPLDMTGRTRRTPTT